MRLSYTLFAQVDASTQAQLQLSANAAAFDAQAVAVSNAQVVAAAYDESMTALTIYITMDVDDSGVGVDLQMTLHQAQIFMDMGDAGGYVFSFSADDEAGLEALIASADTLELAGA